MNYDPEAVAKLDKMLDEEDRRATQIAKNIEIGEEITEPILPTILTLDEMLERLVFVGSNGAVADRVTGRIRKKEYAADEYAASKYCFTVKVGKKGSEKEVEKEVPTLRLWIKSEQRVTVDVLTWVPGAPQICCPPEGGKTGFNSWRGLCCRTPHI